MRARSAIAGFTLIELMIVVGIVGILAAVAIPAYQDYIARAQMSEAFSISDAVRAGVAEYYERWGRFPADNTQAGLPASEVFAGRYVQSVSVTNGAVEVKLNPKGVNSNIASKSLYWRPATNKAYPSGPLVWICNRRGTPAGFEVVGELGKNLAEDKYVPAACR